MPSVLVTAGALFGARIPLPDEASIGRLATSTIQLPSTQISRNHARIYREGDGWHLEDLGSRNGTRLDQAPLRGSAQLSPGAVIHLGEISLIFDPDVELTAARYGEAWVLVAGETLDQDPWLAPVGTFGGASGDIAGLAHLMSATVEEEGLVRGILQLLQDRISAPEVVLARLGPEPGRLAPLGVVAAAGPVPMNRGLVERVLERGRAGSLANVPRVTLRGGELERANLGGPALCAPLRLEGAASAVLYAAREPGAPPFNPEEVARVGALASLFAPALDNARRAQLQRRRHRAWVEPERAEGLLSGDSEVATALREGIQEAAADRGPMLLTGPWGSGKERIARLIHAWGPRWEGPILQVACSTLSESQLELLLFGRSAAGRGDAPAHRLERPVIGKAVLADGGTLYLDRVDTMPAAVQDRLLRLVQSGHVWRLRSTRARAVDVRVIASSEEPLSELDAAQALRPDLSALFAGRVLEVPSLEERLEDLEPLVEELLARVSVRLGRTIRLVTDDALGILRQRAWPGNLRELEGVLTRAVSFSSGEVLTGEDVALGGDVAVQGLGLGSRLRDTLSEAEGRVLAQALSVAGGDLGSAARLVGMDRRGFQRRWRQLGLDRDPS